jgi:hypothetical protein
VTFSNHFRFIFVSLIPNLYKLYILFPIVLKALAAQSHIGHNKNKLLAEGIISIMMVGLTDWNTARRY